MPKTKDKDKPWVGNYPPLASWLDKIDARCINQIPVGDREDPRAYLEIWQAKNRVFIVEVYNNRNGWNIYTDGNTSDIAQTIADAEQRLGLDPETSEKRLAREKG